MNQWKESLQIKELDSRNSEYMSRNWHIPECPECQTRLVIKDVYIGQRYIRQDSSCPECGWVPDCE